MFCKDNCFLIWILILSLSAFSCDENVNYESETAIDGILVVEPAGPLTVGFFEKQTFKVWIENEDGQKVIDANVEVGLLGQPNNGSVVPAKFVTKQKAVDADSGLVTFVAPDEKVDLKIRFKSPAAENEVLVDVAIDPAEFSLDLGVSYEGNRDLSYVEVALFEELECDELSSDVRYDSEMNFQSVDLPASFSFLGLREDRTYSIIATGRNGAGRSRAYGCVDGLNANVPVEDLIISDTPLEISGAYEINMQLPTQGEFDAAVDQFAMILRESFLGKPSSVILDGIAKVLSPDPSIWRFFEDKRAAKELDKILFIEVLEDEPDIGASFDTVWRTMKKYLSHIETHGQLEIGKASGTDKYRFYHQIDEFFLFKEDDENNGFAYTNNSLENGSAEAELDATEGDVLLLNSHWTRIGLGDLIGAVFVKALSEELGANNTLEALGLLIDCNSLALALSPFLDGLIFKDLLISGCEIAMKDAPSWTKKGVAELNNQYYEFRLTEGYCVLDEPLYNDVVKRFSDGTFTLNWTGSTADAALGPLTVSFTADLSTQN